MKGILGMALVAMVVCSAHGQQNIGGAYRFKIRHADPWFVKSLLEGNPSPFPEISTVLALRGGMAGMMTGQAINQMLARGRWMVNPTDNSLWFFPEKPASTQ